MEASVMRFLDLFRTLAGDAAEVWCGDRGASRRFFKGTTYAQRHKDWFPGDERLLPRRAMRHLDYDVLRQLLTRAHDKTGKRIIGDALIHELDKAYSFYISEMDRVDARRNRGLTGRTLHFTAACERVDRLFASSGARFEDLADYEFFIGWLRPTLMDFDTKGKFQESIRISRAICLRLEKTSAIIPSHLRNIYKAWCAYLGSSSARQAEDELALAYFNSYLDRVYADIPDVAVQAMLWWGARERGHMPDAMFRCLRLTNKMPKSQIFGGNSVFGFFDAAVYASEQGCGLDEATHHLGNRSPDQLLTANMDHWLRNNRGYSDRIVFSTATRNCVSRAEMLIREKRLEEGWQEINRARKYLCSIEGSAPYHSLCIKEAEASAHKLEWELRRDPGCLIRHVKETEIAAKLADALLLQARAERLRQINLS